MSRVGAENLVGVRGHHVPRAFHDFEMQLLVEPLRAAEKNAQVGRMRMILENLENLRDGVGVGAHIDIVEDLGRLARWSRAAQREGGFSVVDRTTIVGARCSIFQRRKVRKNLMRGGSRGFVYDYTCEQRRLDGRDHHDYRLAE